MDPSTKRQLVGAAVLVALAVIFLPMIFSGSGEQRPESLDVPVEVPPRPEGAGGAAEQGRAAEQGGGQQQAGQPPSIELPEVDTPPAEGGSGAAEAPAGGAEEAPSRASAAPAEERRAAAEQQPEREASAGEARPGGSAETDAGASSAGAGDSGAGEGVSLGEGDYAVQVGSFRKESNARAERDRIRDLGIPAYLEVVEYEGETMHRVRVGPVMGREEAEALLERVTEAADVNGFVVQR